MELLLPSVQVPVLKHPSYEKLDMAFGVGAGTSLFDKSRFRSHGAITGAAWAAGVHGYCLDFDPTVPSYVEIPAAHTQLNFIVEDFSIVARIYVEDLTVSRLLFMRGLLNADGYYFFVTTTGELMIRTNQLLASQATRSSAGDIVIGNWYTVGVSRDEASIRTFRNGVDVTTVIGAHINPLTCARTAKIGIHDALILNPWDGKIEFLRIFGGIALTASEQLAWHNALA